jgi:hypothetical protein
LKYISKEHQALIIAVGKLKKKLGIKWKRAITANIGK